MLRPRLLTLLLCLCACGEAPVAVTEAPPRTSTPSRAADSAREEPAPEPRTIEREDGIRIDVVEAGSGAPLRVGDRVSAHVDARVADAEEPFLSTRSSGRPMTWSLDVGAADTPIEGLRRALGELRVGDRATIHVPAALGYGERGLESSRIPADADLVFDVRIKRKLSP